MPSEIVVAMQILEKKLSEMTTKLEVVSGTISTLNNQLQQASTVTSKHTAALVKWTKVLAFVTAAYAASTLGMLLVMLFRSPR
ncbi:MAG: hypothetical protein ABSH06_23535 [Thermodesulfobacteriota bacterium]